MSLIDNLEKILADGKDGAMVRFGLGNAYFQRSDCSSAVEHLRKALEFDPGYSAAWKLLGRALVELGQFQAAREAFERGIHEAEEKGDKQAIKEMRVFLKRITNRKDW